MVILFYWDNEPLMMSVLCTILCHHDTTVPLPIPAMPAMQRAKATKCPLFFISLFQKPQGVGPGNFHCILVTGICLHVEAVQWYGLAF